MTPHSQEDDWQYHQAQRAVALKAGSEALGIADWTHPLHSPAPEWLLPGLLQKQAIHILTSDTGCCKTWLGLSMLLSGLTGSPVLDIRPSQRFSSLYLAADSPEWDIGQQLSALLRAQDLPSLPTEPRSFIMPMGFLFENATHISIISDFVRHWGIDAFFIDVLLYSHTGDENDNSYMARTVLRMAKQLRDDLGLAIYILHHNSKPRPDMAVSYRGAGTIVQAAEHHQTLARRGESITLHVGKVRGPATLPDIQFSLSPMRGGKHLLRLQAATTGGPHAELPGLRTLLQWLQANGPLTRAQLRAKASALSPGLDKAYSWIDNALQYGRRVGALLCTDGRWHLTVPTPSGDLPQVHS